MELRLLGYWRSESEPHWPDPHEFVDTGWDAYERRVVARYLSGGTPTPWVACGFSRCRFCNEPNGTMEFTDGTYVWPEGLAHYITEHDVRLPSEFVAHVWSPSEQLDHAEVDESWWRQQRSA